jgi:tetratricopeptide (TPR) repeat protein
MHSLAYAYRETGQYSKSMQALATALTIERRRVNSYIVSAMAGTLIEAYDHPDYREKLELTEEGGDKMLSVNLRRARLLSDLREYEKADVFLQEAIESNPDHDLARELNETIQEKLQKNRKLEELMHLGSHPPYTASMTYRRSLDLFNFILTRYTPMQFAVGWLLDQAEKASQPDDPFVLWYRIKWYKKTSDVEKLVPALEEATGKYYERIGDWDRAVEIYTHLLDIYPGEPAWLGYEKKIIRYNENKKTQ